MLRVIPYFLDLIDDFVFLLNCPHVSEDGQHINNISSSGFFTLSSSSPWFSSSLSHSLLLLLVLKFTGAVWENNGGKRAPGRDEPSAPHVVSTRWEN